MCAFTCSPNQQLTTFCLTHLFCWVVHHPHTRHYRRVQQDMAATPERLQVRSLSLRHLAAIASGERPGPTSFQPAPLLPFRPATPGPPAGKRSCRSFGSGKASSGTRMRPYRRTPGPPGPPAAGRRSSVIEMYAPIQELEAAAGVDFEGCHILSYPTDPRGRAGVRVLLELFPLVPCDDRRANLPNHAREASFVARG